MQLVYAHWPHFVVGWVPLAIGVTAIWIGWRGRHADLGVVCGALVSLFLWFVDAAFRGHMTEWLQSYRGFLGASLGLGYWVMVSGTALMVVGGVLAAAGGGPSGEASHHDRPDREVVRPSFTVHETRGAG
jgi:hypothetical protein